MSSAEIFKRHVEVYTYDYKHRNIFLYQCDLENKGQPAEGPDR